MKLNHYAYIDALRGYAILLVIAVHASQAAPSLQGIGRLLVDQGARGVQLFFVASALTLLLSWNTRQDGIAAFYTRRLFRIAPMFWLAIVFFIFIEGFGPRYFAPNGIDGLAVFLTAIFFHGWHPETITSVVHGGWSIAVEMTFYLIFPLLVYLIRGMRAALLAFFVSVVMAKLTYKIIWEHRITLYPNLSDDLINTFLTLWFPNQLPVFMVGFVLFFAIRSRTNQLSKWVLNVMLLVSIALMVALAIKPQFYQVIEINLYTAYGMVFGVFAFCLSQGVGSWLVNFAIRYLGKISFSAYLWHFAVLTTVRKFKWRGLSVIDLMDDGKGYLFFLQFFIYVVAVTVVLSSITYFLVERPMIKAGNKFILKMKLDR